MNRILLAGAEGFAAGELALELQRAGCEVLRAENGSEALRLVSAGGLDLVATEWEFPDLADGAFMRRVKRRDPALPVVLFGRRVDAGRRREMLASGAEDYLQFPLELGRAAATVRAALERRGAPADSLLLGTSDAIRQVVATISQIAPYKVSVLVTGESGTGKELVARSIHLGSPRRELPFVAVNCGAIPPGILESELFGHEKGAFTGAVGERKGRFELADGGTLFLDEVGELPPATQVELLRVLEEERFLRVGGTREVKVDVRIVAATNRDLEGAVRDGLFRQDLYHRLRVVSVRLPPLRERPGDIPLLVHHFIAAAATRHGIAAPRISAEALEQLARLPWPGNVRELRNVVDSLVILADGREITPADLPPEAAEAAATPNVPVHLRVTREEAEKELLYQSLLALRAEISEIKHLILRGGPVGSGEPGIAPGAETSRRPWQAAPPGTRVPSAPSSMSEIEEEAVRSALAFTGGNRREAAKLLGIGLRTLYRKIRLYGIG